MCFGGNKSESLEVEVLNFGYYRSLPVCFAWEICLLSLTSGVFLGVVVVLSLTSGVFLGVVVVLSLDDSSELWGIPWSDPRMPCAG